MSNIQTPKDPVSLAVQPWCLVTNTFTQAIFTHLSPHNTNVLSYKFLLCAISGWQQMHHVQKITAELWNPHDIADNDAIPDVVMSSFEDADERRVTLWFEELSQFCAVSRKTSKKQETSNKDEKTSNRRKTYKKDQYANAFRQAELIHISTEKPTSVAEWATYRAGVHKKQEIEEDDVRRHYSIFTDADQYDSPFLPNGRFIGHPIERVEINPSKPLVTITFNPKFLPLLFATSRYSTMHLSRLEHFKSLAGLRLYDLLYSRVNALPPLEDRGRVNYSVPWWRAFFGISNSIEILLIEAQESAETLKECAESQNPLQFTWAELEDYVNPKRTYHYAEKKNYKSLSQEDALIFDDSRKLLINSYHQHNKEKEKEKNELSLYLGMTVHLNRGKYLDIKALSRDVFNKAIKEVNEYAISKGSEHFEVAECNKVKKRGSRTTTSINIIFERRS